MLDYTFAALKKILNDFKKIGLAIKFTSQLFTILYLTYSLIFKTGNLVANIILLVLFVPYVIFDFITYKKLDRKIKRARKKIKHLYAWCRIGVNAFTLGVAIYGLYTSSVNLSAFSTILTTLLIITWVLQVLIEIIVGIFENKWQLLEDAFAEDKRRFTQPINKVGNFFKKIVGKEVKEEEPKRSKAILALEAQIEKEKQAKRLKKQQEKADKKALKKEKSNHQA